jgi:hypothetical protein
LERQLAAGLSSTAVEAAVNAYRAEIDRLRARVAELEAREPERVEVPVLTAAGRDRMDEAFRTLLELAHKLAPLAPGVARSGLSPASSRVSGSPPALRPPGPAVLEESAARLNGPRAPVTGRALTKAERTLLGVLANSRRSAPGCNSPCCRGARTGPEVTATRSAGDRGAG